MPNYLYNHMQTWPLTNRLVGASVVLCLALVGSATHAQGIDASFANGAGQFTFNRLDLFEAAYDSALDSQGRLVIAALFEETSGDWTATVIRLLPSGSVDLTFGFLGFYQEASIECLGNHVISVTVDSADRPIFGCSQDSGTMADANVDWAIRRITAGGVADIVLDVDFAFGGASNDEDRLQVIRALPNGNLVAAGSAQFSGEDFDMAVARWVPTAQGGLTPDTVLSSDGRATVSFDLGGGDYDEVRAFLQEGTQIILVGYAQKVGGFDIAIARLNANGGPDISFNSTGRATYAYQDFGGPAYPTNLAFDFLFGGVGGGYILAGMVRDSSGVESGALLKVGDNGAVDTGWGSQGWTINTMVYPGDLFVPGDTEYRRLRADNQGRLLAGGNLGRPGSAESRGIVTRLTTTGFPDTSFAPGGTATYGLEPTGQPNATFFFGLERDVSSAFLYVIGARLGATGGVNRADHDIVAARIHLLPAIFSDGFESGNTSAWQ